MKQILLPATLAVLLLTTGCARELPPEQLPDEIIQTTPAETLSPEDLTLVDRAAEALWEAYDLPAREHFRPAVFHEDGGAIEVDMWLCIGGHRTSERYIARFSHDGTLLRTDTVNPGTYSPYLAVLDPADLAAAEAELAAFFAAYDKYQGGGYLKIDGEGYLCLAAELIVELDPPPLSGLFSEGGCNVDHEHKFFNKRICPAP